WTGVWSWCTFFFSSRRRHTRSKRDWSSDGALPILKIFGTVPAEIFGKFAPYPLVEPSDGNAYIIERVARKIADLLLGQNFVADEIGRASCRERGYDSWGGAPVQGRAQRSARPEVSQ